MKNEKTVKMKKTVLKTLVLTGAVLVSVSVPVAASSNVTNVTSGIEIMKTLFFSIIGGLGAITAGKGIMEAAQGYQNRDSTLLNEGLKSVVSGGLMASVSTLTALFL